MFIDGQLISNNSGIMVIEGLLLSSENETYKSKITLHVHTNLIEVKNITIWSEKDKTFQSIKGMLRMDVEDSIKEAALECILE
ncbi:hypothetical protein ACFVAD_20335 [Sutcliffiella sp. NPDC057660]|uniref:hypothetical protein n=1 Tax=Sutcliffiella sp. NPDC057660 TaxID=3346199 RepID=UPI00369B1CA4